MTKNSLLLIAVSSLLLFGCGGNNSSDRGVLSLSLTDAPVDNATAVVVEFTGVEIKPKNGSATRYTLDEHKTVNLLALQNGVSTSLIDLTLDAGEYNWIRLLINAEEGLTDSYIELQDGTRWPLHIPSGAETGLKLHNSFVIAAGSRHNFTVDFDLRKSVNLPKAAGADYLLRPSLRIVDELIVGGIQGAVDASLVTAEGCSDTSAVYLYDGLAAETGEEGSATAPFTSATVAMNDDGDYVFHLAFVEAGDYTIAFTCQAGDDLPETIESIVISSAQDVTVLADEVETVSF